MAEQQFHDSNKYLTHSLKKTLFTGYFDCSYFIQGFIIIQRCYENLVFAAKTMIKL